MALWHETVIKQMEQYSASDPAVRGLVVTGSCANRNVVPDEWSDVDLALIVEDEAYSRFFPAMDWASAFGDIYAYSSSSTEYFGVLRLQFSDGIRVDFVIIPEKSLESIEQWSIHSFHFGARCICSRSDILDQALAQLTSPPVLNPQQAEQVDTIANDFWFKAMIAVTKVARNDLLIASHLALDLARSCLVLKMIMRDNAIGTNHHRHGTNEHQHIEWINPSGSLDTSAGILDYIRECAVVFDSLAGQLIDNYKDHRFPLVKQIEKAIASLSA